MPIVHEDPCVGPRDDWSIRTPQPKAHELIPGITLSPLVGWDETGLRLGHRDGYFDRTLTALIPPPFAIGIGFHGPRLTTIDPQPHDIIPTETGVQFACATT